MVFLKEFFKKFDFEKNQQTTKSMKNFPGGKVLKKDHNSGLSMHTTAVNSVAVIHDLSRLQFLQLLYFVSIANSVDPYKTDMSPHYLHAF